MITTKKIKICTIITHALIVVGFGHGILFFILIEFLWFPSITKVPFSFLFNSPFESRLPVIGLTALLGQGFLIFSILIKRNNFKIISHIVGLILLWLSIVYFTYDIERDYRHIATITCIPFVICTITTFAGQIIKRVYNWILN